MPLPRFLRQTVDFLGDAVREPREELTRQQQRVRHAFELSSHCWRALDRHRAQGMAAELTYRTIFALIPLAVLGLALFNVIGGMRELRGRVETQLYAFFGVPEIQYGPAVNGNDQPGERGQVVGDQSSTIPRAVDFDSLLEQDPVSPAAEFDDQQRLLESDIREILSDMIDQVANLDFASIGLIGFLLFIYAALSLTDSVEQVFNRIYAVPDGRPIHLRLAIHWSMITLGTGLLGISLYLSGQFVEFVSETRLGVFLGTSLNYLIGALASWMLLFLLYSLMPNTRVSFRAALIGSLVAALLWEGAKFSFQIYVRTALPYSALYGSLGLIPLFLFWIYVTWLIFLFGLIWTFTLQTVHGRDPASALATDSDRVKGDPVWMLPLMVEIAAAFDRGQPIDRSCLVDRLGLSAKVVQQLCEVLVASGLLRLSEGGDATADSELLLPARPTDKITLDEILYRPLYATWPPPEDPVWQCLRQWQAQWSPWAAQTTLRDLATQGR